MACLVLPRVLRVFQFLIAGGVLVSAFPLKILDNDLVYGGPDVVLPKCIRKVEPTYPEGARKASIQGDVLLEVTIDENGSTRDLVILAPLGHEFDEQALICVSKWRFKPATKAGKPVNFRATISISFRMAGRPFDEKAEQRRVTSEMVKALLAHRAADGRISDDSVKIMQDLATHKNAGAEYFVGLWELQGDVLPKDQADGLRRVQSAAKEDEPAALVFLGIANMDGTLVPKDSKKGLTFLHKAAALNSVDAQLQVGTRYMDGNGVGVDINLARKYLQSCARSGKSECQSRLQKLASTSPESLK